MKLPWKINGMHGNPLKQLKTMIMAINLETIPWKKHEMTLNSK